MRHVWLLCYSAFSHRSSAVLYPPWTRTLRVISIVSVVPCIRPLFHTNFSTSILWIFSFGILTRTDIYQRGLANGSSYFICSIPFIKLKWPSDIFWRGSQACKNLNKPVWKGVANLDSCIPVLGFSRVFLADSITGLLRISRLELLFYLSISRAKEVSDQYDEPFLEHVPWFWWHIAQFVFARPLRFLPWAQILRHSCVRAPAPLATGYITARLHTWTLVDCTSCASWIKHTVSSNESTIAKLCLSTDVTFVHYKSWPRN